MKLAKLAYLLTLGLVLSIGATGCKKGLDKTTQIPGRGARSITDERSTPRDIDNGAPLTGGLNTDPGGLGNNAGGNSGTPLAPANSDIPVAKGDFSNWKPDAETFKNQTVLFDFDKSVIKASEVPKLEEVARRMKSEFAGKALRIEGHCDERGTEEYNRSLGDRRALSIREKLVQLGMDPEILPTISYGEERPADPGHDDAAWAKNRRGELILLSPPGSN